MKNRDMTRMALAALLLSAPCLGAEVAFESARLGSVTMFSPVPRVWAAALQDALLPAPGEISGYRALLPALKTADIESPEARQIFGPMVAELARQGAAPRTLAADLRRLVPGVESPAAIVARRVAPGVDAEVRRLSERAEEPAVSVVELARIARRVRVISTAYAFYLEPKMRRWAGLRAAELTARVERRQGALLEKAGGLAAALGLGSSEKDALVDGRSARFQYVPTLERAPYSSFYLVDIKLRDRRRDETIEGQHLVPPWIVRMPNWLERLLGISWSRKLNRALAEAHAWCDQRNASAGDDGAYALEARAAGKLRRALAWLRRALDRFGAYARRNPGGAARVLLAATAAVLAAELAVCWAAMPLIDGLQRYASTGALPWPVTVGVEALVLAAAVGVTSAAIAALAALLVRLLAGGGYRAALRRLPGVARARYVPRWLDSLYPWGYHVVFETHEDLRRALRAGLFPRKPSDEPVYSYYQGEPGWGPLRPPP